MSVGTEIRRLRAKAGRSQRDLARAADVAEAYLSRVENGRVTPTLRTLGRLAGALGVEIPALLGCRTFQEEADRCPVSLSGRCILDELSAVRGRHRKAGCERYRTDDVETLRLCNLVLQSGDRHAAGALATIVRSMLMRNKAEE